ncbi:MAG: ATP-binding protein [Atopobiaceae bacterium]
MEFIGRRQELDRLIRELSDPSQRNVLVYGRRRVGKSELIKQALKKLPCSTVYFECTQTSEAENLGNLSRAISEALGFPPLAFSGFHELADFLFRQAEHADMVLVLDEYPYLRDAVAGLDSILQVLIDTYREASHLKLILCGSFVDVMRSLIERENPLYGRIDLTLKLDPMDYCDAGKFFPSFSPEDRVHLYSVFGGIPYYNRLVSPSKTVRDNIIDLVTAPGARLESEVEVYLSQEVSKMANANEVFLALAQGYSRWKDILAQSHVSSGQAMTAVLDKLISMELVQKQTPINDPENKRKTGYFIIDPLALFYYRYIFRNASARQIQDAEYFYSRYIERDFEENHVPHLFEEVCRQYLIRKNRTGKMEIPFDAIGKYWYDDPFRHTNGEFDVVTKDPRGYIFYEAKFRKTPITQKMVEEEISQVRAAGLPCYRFGFFSRSGFDVEPDPDLILIDLPELYA